jgi:glycosyltransferase involved in cell wall biosynthesis
MPAINFVSLNPLGLLPLMRYIIPTLAQNKIVITTPHIEGFYTFQEFGVQRNTITFRNVDHLNSKSMWERVLQYYKSLTRILGIVIPRRNAKIYLIDYQLVAFAIWLKKHIRKKLDIIYHQFELFDPSIDRSLNKKLQYYVFKNAAWIDLVIFPETNRLLFFKEQSGLENINYLIIPNTNNLHPVVGKDPLPDNLFSPEQIVIAHVGNVGTSHYIHSYLHFIENNHEANLRFLFIGFLESRVKQLIEKLSASDHRVIYIEQMPHDQLLQYYQRIDLGIILYKGVDKNNEFCAPNKLYEYWAYGIPVIAHRLDGLTGIWKHDFMGELIDLESGEQIQEAIHKMIRLKKEYRPRLLEYFSREIAFNCYAPMLKNKIIGH